MRIISGYDDWDEIDLLAGTIFGEARGEPKVGQLAIGLTIQTRVHHPRWWGGSWREVILCPRQFSCWEDVNAEKIRKARELKTEDWNWCYDSAERVYTENTIDFVGRPTHYHSVRVHPDWSAGMKRLMTIGNHVFYRDLREVP